MGYNFLNCTYMYRKLSVTIRNALTFSVLLWICLHFSSFSVVIHFFCSSSSSFIYISRFHGLRSVLDRFSSLHLAKKFSLSFSFVHLLFVYRCCCLFFFYSRADMCVSVLEWEGDTECAAESLQFWMICFSGWLCTHFDLSVCIFRLVYLWFVFIFAIPLRFPTIFVVVAVVYGWMAVGAIIFTIRLCFLITLSNLHSQWAIVILMCVSRLSWHVIYNLILYNAIAVPHIKILAPNLYNGFWDKIWFFPLAVHLIFALMRQFQANEVE